MLVEQHVTGPVVGITPLLEDASKQIYRAERVGGPALVVRVFPASRPIARVHGDLAVLAHAVAAAIPAEPPIAALELDGRGVAVTGFVPGDPADCTAGDLEQLGAIAGRLSALAPVAGDAFLGRDAGSRPVDDLTHARADLARIRAAVPPAERAAFEALEAAVARTHDGGDLPHALVHPDCQPSNAVRDPGGRVALIDWEGAGVGPRLWPLAVLVFQAAASGGELALDRIAPIIEGFVRHATADPRELDRLPDLIRVRPLAIAVRRFARATEAGRPDPAHGWWSRHPEADAVAERVRAELVRRAGVRSA